MQEDFQWTASQVVGMNPFASDSAV